MRKILETEITCEKNTKASLFHKLTGENIYFKALDTKDAEKIHKYASDKEVKHFIGRVQCKEA